MTTEEIRHAERAIISCVQKECYSGKIKLLKSSRMAVTRQSSLRALDPILIDGMLCVGGRLRHLPVEMNDNKHPAILPKNHHIVDMIVRHYYHLSGHSAQPRGAWPLGRVLEVKQGRDGLVRSARIKTAMSEYLRPIDKLCLLKAAESEEKRS
eukprot:Seg884.2 transcript_id=Seg884.2/GoldUCD/mRNA.D3Y31 product="hypothetical protein" protein_id=Seg884.2/GoldUCD/D3Y31